MIIEHSQEVEKEIEEQLRREIAVYASGENVGKSQLFVPAPKEKRKTKQIAGGVLEFEYFKILDEYDPWLQRSAMSWDFPNPPGDLKYICVSMVETMAKNEGVGLAANQVGLPYAIFVMGGGGYANAIVNPKILVANGEELSQEGCLSYPGLFLKIKRANHIDVEFYDMNGKIQFRTFEGLTARIFLHEYDHLLGKVFTSLVSRFSLQRERDKRKTNLKRINKSKEINKRQQKIAALSQQVKTLQSQIQPTTNIVIKGDTPTVSAQGVIDLNTYKA
jgi:peptide deformylase